MRSLFVFVLTCLLATATFAQNKDAAIYSTKAGAIKGYDPVAYFTEGQPVKGQADITFTWENATWHFSSEANRQLFAAEPEKYAPQYGGWCAYGWSQGYPAKIDPKAWSIVDDQLYLNYNKKIQKDWTANQDEFIRQANQNYDKNFSKN